MTLVIINSAIWRTFGSFSAFVIALAWPRRRHPPHIGGERSAHV